MYGYIYKTTCLVNNKIYIGRHKASIFEPQKYIGSGKAFLADVKKFGKKNFICELLDTAEDSAELNEKEIYYIELYNCRDPQIGYNKVKGGSVGNEGMIVIRKEELWQYIFPEELTKYEALGWVKQTIEETRHKYYLKHKQEYLEWQKQDRLNNPEKQYVKNHNWYLKNKEKVKQAGKVWRSKNKDKVNEYQRKRIAENRDEINRKQREYRHKNAELLKQKRNAYNASHRAEINTKQNKRNLEKRKKKKLKK